MIKHFALPLKRLDFVPPVTITNKCNQGLKCSQETKVKRRKVQKAKTKGLRLSMTKCINRCRFKWVWKAKTEKLICCLGDSLPDRRPLAQLDKGQSAVSGGRGFKPWADRHSGSLNNLKRVCCRCSDIYMQKRLDILVFSDKDERQGRKAQSLSQLTDCCRT